MYIIPLFFTARVLQKARDFHARRRILVKYN
jgi:hypothetical protein